MSEELGSGIVGTWELVSWQFTDNEGGKQDFFGENPVGVLMYDNCGYMNVQIMKAGRPDVSTDSLMDGNPDELSQAFVTYFAYYGTYIEEEPGKVVHTVVGSLTPNWLGDEHIRYAKIKEGMLMISTPIIPTKQGEIVHHITWKKIKKKT